MSRVSRRFCAEMLPGNSADKTALLINPPIYDTQYWAEWSQPYGLLRIARLLRNLGDKRRELFDFMERPYQGTETRGETRKMAQRRIAPGESFIEKDAPAPKSPPTASEKTARTSICGSTTSAEVGRSRSFQIFGDTMVAQALRRLLRNGFEDFVRQFRENSVSDRQ